MSKKVYVLLADGFELIEALAPVDVLRRGGVEVVTVAIGENKEVVSAQKVTVHANAILSQSNLSDGDVLVLPGGYPGYVNLANCEKVGELVKDYANKHKYIAAICGGPTVLSKNGILKGKCVTCHHSVATEMKDYNYTGNLVERDDNLITGIGAGRAIDFGLKIAEVLLDETTIENIKKGMELSK